MSGFSHNQVNILSSFFSLREAPVRAHRSLVSHLVRAISFRDADITSEIKLTCSGPLTSLGIHFRLEPNSKLHQVSLGLQVIVYLASHSDVKCPFLNFVCQMAGFLRELMVPYFPSRTKPFPQDGSCTCFLVAQPADSVTDERKDFLTKGC